MIYNRNDIFLSFVSSLTAGLLLFGYGYSKAGVLFLTSAVYFIYKLKANTKINAPDDFHVVIVGSGFSGIIMGYKLGLLGINYTIIEKSNGMGGTWYDNFYPGVACDVPSHLYSLSFFPNPYWSRAYSKGKEILQYMQEAASRFGIYPHIVTGKRVSQLTWNKSNKTWKVDTTDGTTYTANVIISGCGGLHVPRQPNFPGMEEFSGIQLHTALWKRDLDVKGKRVAVIGTGASAVQAVPNLAEMGLKNLTVYQRTPCWSPPRLDIEYPDLVKNMFAYLPFTNTIYRWYFFLRNELFYRIFVDSSSYLYTLLNTYTHTLIKKHYSHVLKDKELVRKLIPNYPLGCKRITPSDTYLEAYNKDNVTLVTDKIKTLNKSGIETEDGKQRDHDIIVYAIGFDLVKTANPFRVVGPTESNVTEKMGDTPMAYYGITNPMMPNFYFLLGPGTGLAHNSIIYMIECQANYAISGITKMLDMNAKALTLKPERMTSYWNWTQEMMKGKVFASNNQCVGWYRNERGVNWTLWPLDLITYWWRTMSLDLNDYAITY